MYYRKTNVYFFQNEHMNIYYITRFFYTCNHLHSKQPFKTDIINARAREGGGRDREKESPARRDRGKSIGNNINAQK